MKVPSGGLFIKDDTSRRILFFFSNALLSF